MDGVKLLKELDRMCTWYNRLSTCEECPLIGCDFSTLAENADGVISSIEKWSKEHPVKSNAEKFKEVFGVQPSPAGYQQNHTKAAGMPVEWWAMPYEEPKEE